MDRWRHLRERPWLRKATILMAVFLLVAAIFAVIDTTDSSSSYFQNLPESHVDLGTVVGKSLGSSVYHRIMSQRRTLHDSWSSSFQRLTPNLRRLLQDDTPNGDDGPRNEHTKPGGG